ncbi:restriction endonuclease subunit S [Enterococcus italicus]|uniref:Type I restriction modification DNA specificity domain protein n=1 Tax=Enterococcus italicus (strain DSM 15952 / CCUG 50447 / LMG 22039 / TP 1.5) TaxID=888064 RepID=E6LHD9_ENTI1|nr:restriction endonuclease subunit S [Enterococcus italicus]EFU73393.1 type I restriction modification DNA specificity domain protein [Enterococcus italicus DSM 15952]
MNPSRTPSVRFKGYEDEWEERKLGELASFSKGNGYTKNDLVEFGDPIILYGRLYTKYETVIEKVDTFVNKKDNSIISEGSEVIVPASGESSEDISRASVVGKSGLILGGDLNIIKPVNYIDSIFLALTISNGSQQQEMSKRAQGKSVVHLHNSDLKQVNLLYPKLEEQQKIGSFFKKLDNTISLHQRKLNLLNEQKKGFLQKMFPKNGEIIPEIRFAGFNDDWEERKLGDHAKYRRGSFPQPYGNKEWYDGEGAMPFVQVVDVTNKLTLVENTKQKISKLAQSKSVFVPKGKVVVTLQGSIGRVAITQYDSFVDRTLLIFEDYEKETDERFWAYTIQKKFEIEKLKAPGGTIKTITKEALSSFNVHLPKFEEQQKIGSFFKQLDDTIALHQRKIDELKLMKKSMLQKMFV